MRTSQDFASVCQRLVPASELSVSFSHIFNLFPQDPPEPSSPNTFASPILETRKDSLIAFFESSDFPFFSVHRSFKSPLKPPLVSYAIFFIDPQPHLIIIVDEDSSFHYSCAPFFRSLDCSAAFPARVSSAVQSLAPPKLLTVVPNLARRIRKKIAAVLFSFPLDRLPIFLDAPPSGAYHLFVVIPVRRFSVRFTWCVAEEWFRCAFPSSSSWIGSNPEYDAGGETPLNIIFLSLRCCCLLLTPMIASLHHLFVSFYGALAFRRAHLSAVFSPS